MIGLAALLGVAAGIVLALLVRRQIESDATAPKRLLVAVALLAGACCTVLWLRWGWTPRFWLLGGAALVLIDTAAVDWQLRLIDTLLLLIAAVVAVACAPWIVEGPAARWSSAIGMLAAGGAFGLAWLAARLLYPNLAEPFGLGDVLLAAFIGALFGSQHIATALLLGIVGAGLAALALIVVCGYRRARGVALPYGTFLCLGALAYLLVL